MAATDEDLQKLGKPPVYRGKDDEWSRWSFVMKSCMSLLSTHVPASQGTATSPDMSSSHRSRDSGQETLPRLGDEREGTSAGSDQRNHRHERSIGMASVDHEMRSKHSAASTESPENDPQCEDLSSELTACEIALDEWQENTRRWQSISGDRFNVLMKKALFLDKPPSLVRVPLQM